MPYIIQIAQSIHGKRTGGFLFVPRGGVEPPHEVLEPLVSIFFAPTIFIHQSQHDRLTTPLIDRRFIWQLHFPPLIDT